MRGKISPKFHVKNVVKNGKFHAIFFFFPVCWGAALTQHLLAKSVDLASFNVHLLGWEVEICQCI